MAKGINIHKVTHAAMPEHLYQRLIVMARDMALGGDGDVADWLVNEVMVLRATIIEKEFAALKKNREFTECFYSKPCVVCGDPSDTIDHIIPVSDGGTNDLSNLQSMCRSCNSRKSNT